MPLKLILCKCTDMQTRFTQSDIKINQGVSPIQYAMRTYLAPALFNSKVNELKRHVPKNANV